MIERIIFDWKRTLYDPAEADLLPGADHVLKTLSEHPFELILIGKGGDDMHQVLDTLDARKFFQSVHFVPSKSDDLFASYISSSEPEKSLVIGDRAQGEIAIGKRLGAKAIWIRAGEFSDELPYSDVAPPDEVVTDIRDVLQSPLLFPKYE